MSMWPMTTAMLFQAYNGLTITAYNDGALAFGTDAEGRFSQLLYSKDGGITLEANGDTGYSVRISDFGSSLHRRSGCRQLYLVAQQ